MTGVFPLNRRRLPRSLIAVVAANFLVLSAFSCFAATFAVTNINDSGAGSFRQAILDANANSGLDTISFQIPGAGVHTLSPLSAFPPITDPVIIVATAQSGYAGKPLIELNGTSGGGNAGLRLLAGGSSVTALCINRFGTHGIDIEGPGTNVVRSCYIGTDPTGTIARGNTFEGVFVSSSSGNAIGGALAGDQNLISGNGDVGIYIFNGSGNVVQGNYVGTGVGGTNSLGNTNHGILLYNSSGNTVGGAASSARNLVSGNAGSGIFLFGPDSTGNTIQNNYIGTDFSGGFSIANLGDGIDVSGASGNTLGGSTAVAGNVISGNGQTGIYLSGPGVTNNSVLANRIGTTAAGTGYLGNAFAGITLSAANGNFIGGTLNTSGNVISGNKQDGIFLTNGVGNIIAGNYIGVNSGSSSALSNGFNGITVSGANNNTIGATTFGGRNVVSGNAFNGIQFSSGASGNSVLGSFIGADATGKSGIANQSAGIRVESPANTIGGTASGAGNVISGNGQQGILIIGATASTNIVQGNFIGVGLGGTNGLGNVAGGIGIAGGAAGNLVGGGVPGAGNVISANQNAGVYLTDAGTSGNLVRGNKIGTDVTGAVGMGNTFEGIYATIASANTFGGSGAGEGNLIAANNTSGIWLFRSPGNTIQRNTIGTKIDGVTPLGNAFSAIDCDTGSTNNLIGGSGGLGNIIAFSGPTYAGVRVRTGSLNNRILGNSIFSNGALGIDLGGTAGVTPNDNCDLDGGANNLQNYPVLVQAYASSSLGIRGTLNSTANTSFTVQFFASPTCDPSGFGEGQIYLGDKTVTTAGDCNSSFVAYFSIPVPVGYVITATASDLLNTSEFSACVPVANVPRLDIARSTNQVTLAWTNAAPGFILKQTPSLTPPIVWSAVTNVPAVANNQYTVSLPVSTATNRFYLLSFE